MQSAGTGESKDGTHPATAYSAVIFGGILYIAGVYYNGSQSVACYWTINGSNISRTDFAGSNGWARGIALR